MASYSTNEFRGGLKVMMDGDPCSIIENEFVKPGKGQAFNRVKIRNLKTGRVLEKTFKSGETLEAADVMDIDIGHRRRNNIAPLIENRVMDQRYTPHRYFPRWSRFLA